MTRTSLGRPTKAEARARTEQLLDTARIIFSHKGYAGTSIEELAAKLKASKHTIYRRFPTKLDLLEAVVDRDVSAFVETLRGASAGLDDPQMTLREIARAYYSFGLDAGYAALYGAIVREAAASPPLRAKLDAWAGAALAPLRETIAEAFPGADPMESSEILADLMDGAAARARWALSDNPDHGFEDVFEARWSRFVDLMKSDAKFA
jgi:AcrR family transcriptional regulator